MVQGDSFHKLLEKLDLRYQLSSQKTLSDKVILALYNNVKDIKVLPGLKDAKYLLPLPVIAGQVKLTRVVLV